VRLYVFARHAHSTLNVSGRINGDPAVPVELTDDGRAEALALGVALANVPLEVCVHTRFGRTRETARLAIGERPIPLVEETLFDDVDVGELEGSTVDDYRAWKAEHSRSDPFPGGESLDDTARRYVRGFRVLLDRPEATMLVVCHEIPIRYALNAAARSDDLDGPVHAIPNAAPFLFDEDALARAADRIAALVECG
jgi:2,3-bisphosphoglycerate-dependent phosphoglycerate mutase